MDCAKRMLLRLCGTRLLRYAAVCSMLQLQRVGGINGTQPGENLTHTVMLRYYTVSGFRTYPVLSCPHTDTTETVLENRSTPDHDQQASDERRFP